MSSCPQLTPQVYTEEDKEIGKTFVFCAACHEGVGMYESRYKTLHNTGEIATKMSHHKCEL